MFLQKKKIFLIILCSVLAFSSLSCEKLKVFWLPRKAKEYHNAGKYKEAIAVYKEVIELDPKNAENYWDLGIAYLDIGDVKNARKQIEELKRLKSYTHMRMLEAEIKKSKKAGEYREKYIKKEAE